MAHERVLVVDDEQDLARSCKRLLDAKGYSTEIAADGAEALECIAAHQPDLVLTDLKMPRMDGMELLNRLRQDYPDTAVVMMTAFSTVEDAVNAMQLGAADFVPKPFTPGHLALVVGKVLDERRLRRENRHLKQQLGDRYGFDNIIGKSAAMQGIFEDIRRIADAQISVLITGASGTGKELIARAIHFNSDRRDGPFVPINCGALPENLVESEIFGYEKGAFTGAARAKNGLLEEADGGTFFMDEVAELPPALQVKFLRVLEDGRFRRLGGTQERTIDIRLISATNRDIEARVEKDEFREDFYYRINTFTIDIPPLGQRRDDIPLLVNHYLERFAERNGKEVDSISPEAMRLLRGHPWKGNVRELEHVIERAVILARGETLLPADLPSSFGQDESGGNPVQDLYLDRPFKEAKERLIDDFERRYLKEILKRFDGNISRAASHSGIDRRSLHRLLAKHGTHAADLVREE